MTTLKTVSMYLRAAKVEAESAGEDTEGMANSVSELQSKILALTKGQVDIMEADGTTFKSTTEQLREISDVYNDLPDVDQAALLELIGGKRNSNVVAALLRNFDQVEAAIDTAKNSAGSAIAENEKQMESLEGRITQFKSAFESLSSSTLNSSFLKGIVSGGTEAIKVLDDLIKTFGLFGTAVTGIALFKGGKGIFNAAGIEHLKDLKDLKTVLSGFKDSDFRANFLENLSKTFPNLGSAVSNFATSVSSASGIVGKFTAGAKAGFQGLWSVIKANPITSATIGITVAIAAANALMNSYNERIQEQIDKAQSAKQEVESISDAYSTFVDTKSAYYDNSASKDQLTTATNSLLTALGSEGTTLQGLIDKYGTLDAAMKAVNKQTADKISSDRQDQINGIDAFKTDLTRTAKGTSSWGDIFKEITGQSAHFDTIMQSNKSEQWVKDALKNTDLFNRGTQSKSPYRFTDMDDADEVLKTYDKLVKAKKALEKASEDNGGATALSKDQTYQSIVGAIDKVEDKAKALKELYSSINESSAQLDLSKFFDDGGKIPDSIREYNKLRDQLISDANKSGDYVGNTSTITSSIDDVLKKAPQLKKFWKQYGDEMNISESSISQKMRGIKDAFAKNIQSTTKSDSKQDFTKNLFKGGEKQAADAGKTQAQIYTSKIKEALGGNSSSSKSSSQQIFSDVFGKINGKNSAVKTVVDIDVDAEGAKKINQFNDWIDKLSDDEKRIVYDISVNTDGTENWSLEKWQKNLEQNLKIEETKKSLQDFYDIMKDDSDSSFSKNIEGYTDDLTTLQDALSKFNTGDLSKSEISTLMTQFPELTQYSNDLGAGIQSVMNQIVNGTDEAGGLVDAFNDQISKLGEDTAGGKAMAQLRDQIVQAYGEGFADFDSIIDNYVNKFDTLQDAFSKAATGDLSNSEIVSLLRQFPELTQYTDDLGAGISEMVNELINGTSDGTGMLAAFDAQIEQLGDDKEAVANLEAIKEQILSLYDYVGKDFSISIDVETTKLDNLQSAIQESTSATGLGESSMNHIKAMYSSMKGYNYSDLFENTANGIHLNVQELQKLESEYEKTTKSGFEKELTRLQTELATASEKLKTTQEGTAAYDTQNAKISELKKQIEQVQVLKAQYDGLTSSYNKWIEAQSGSNERDEYESVASGKKTVDDLRGEGWYSDDSVRAYLDMLSGKDLSTANVKELNQAYSDLGKTISGTDYSVFDFFTAADDDKGIAATDGIYNFCDAVRERFGQLYSSINEDGSYSLDLTGDKLKEVADGFGMSVESVESILKAASDAGFNVNFDSDLQSADELTSKVMETEAALKSLGQEPVNIDINATDIDSEITSAKSKIDEIKNSDVSMDIKTAQLNDANAKLDVLIQKKIEAGQPEFMSLDASDVDSSLQDALSKLQEYQSAVNTLQELKLRGADASEIDAAQSKVDALAQKIAGLDKDTKIKIGLEPTDSIDDIKKKIASGGVLTMDMKINPTDTTITGKNTTVKADVSGKNEVSDLQTSINGLTSKDVKVKVSVSPSGVAQTLSTVKSAIESVPKSKSATIKISVPDSSKITTLSSSIKAVPKSKSSTITAKANGKAKVDALKKSIIAIPKSRNSAVTAKVTGKEKVTALTNSIKTVPTKKGSSVSASVSGKTAVDNLVTSIGNVKSKTVTVTVKTQYEGGSQADGSAYVSGTAYAHGTAKGTAFLKGSWGAKSSGVALGGELGQELVVRDGRFFTIGDDSAEMFSYRRGDIIFNAEQTKQILTQGKIISGRRRGQRAWADGTATSSVPVFRNNVAYAGGTATGGVGRVNKKKKKKTTKKKTTKKTTKTGGSSTTKKTTGGSSKSSTPSKTSSSNKTSSNKTSSSSKSSGGSSSSSNEKTKIDWIEVILDRASAAVKKFATVAGNAFQNLTTRITAYNNTIIKAKDELKVEQESYRAYMKAAGDVKLSEGLKARVRDGGYYIYDYDDATQKLINEYKQYYEAAQNVAQSMRELQEEIAKYYQERFEAISSHYDLEMKRLGQISDTYDKQLTLLETTGRFASTDLYQQTISINDRKYAKYESEYQDLQKSFDDAVNNGYISKWSDQWWEMFETIEDIKLQMQDVVNSTAEINKKVQELQWDKFDFVQDRISQVTSESDFLIKLLSSSDLVDDNGKFTDKGNATIGLRAISYDTYMTQADKYAEELRNVEEELEADPKNQNIIKRREELLKLQQEAISNANEEKKAISDLVKNAIDKELDALKDLIDKQNDALESAKDLYDYQKKISGYTDKISSLRKQIAAYSGDNSEETQSKLQSLTKDLKDAEEDLYDAQYDKYVSDQKELLDDLYDEYEKALNSRLDDMDALMSEMISSVNSNSDTIRQTIKDASSDVGYTLSDDMNSILKVSDTENGMVHLYGDAMENGFSSVARDLDYIIDLMTAIANNSDELPERPVEAKVSFTNTGKVDLTPGQMEQLKHHIGIKTGTDDGFTTSGSGSRSKNYAGYARGGYIAELQKVVAGNGDDMITVNTLKKGEAVLTVDEARMFSQFINALPVLTGATPIHKVTSATTSSQSVSNDINLSVTLPNVKNYDEFVAQMKRDEKFEKLIKSMSIDLLAGKSSLNKYK